MRVVEWIGGEVRPGEVLGGQGEQGTRGASLRIDDQECRKLLTTVGSERA